MASPSSREEHEECPPTTTSRLSLPLSLPLPLTLPLHQFGSSFPGLFSGFVHSFARNTLSALAQWCPKNDRGGLSPHPQSYYSRQFVITYLPSQNLSFSSSSPRPWSLPTTSLLASPGINSAPPETGESDATAQSGIDGEAAAAAAAASSTGPAFIGQVFTMCDASRRGLIAVRPIDSPKAKKFPYLPSFITSKLSEWVDRGLGTKKDETEGPVFRFYFDKNDAAAYVKHLGLAGSMVGSCPLDAAYKYYKGKPPMFRFIADNQQVKVAKKLLRKDHGRTVARKFRGVPVFTARNLTIAMSTPNGVRWFTPYFFDKSHLDKLIGHSVDHYYHMLIHARRLQRHSQVVDEFPGEPPEDDVDGLMDPPEVQEFMEEIGQGGNPFFESALFKTAEIQFQDMVDNVILGNKLSRKIAGLQPSFPVLVDSFEKRAAAAEIDLRDGPKSSIATAPLRSNHVNGDHPADSGRSDENGGTSQRDSTAIVAQKNEREGRSPFQLFGRNWGFQLHGGRKREASGIAPSKELQDKESTSQLGSSYTDTGQKEAMRKEDPLERIQPKLTMMGIAMTDPETNMSDAVLQRAMAEAAKDIENRVRKGEGSGQEHGPLFIADLGGPPEIWGRDNSTFSGWDSDDNE
ncbi:unnamed protein product [Calypogeia fissa]